METNSSLDTVGNGGTETETSLFQANNPAEHVEFETAEGQSSRHPASGKAT